MFDYSNSFANGIIDLIKGVVLCQSILLEAESWELEWEANKINILSCYLSGSSFMRYSKKYRR